MTKRYHYITPEDYKIAEKNGISKTRLYQRVHCSGWDIDRAITTPVIKRHRKFSNSYLIARKKANENGISSNVFNKRIKALGWSLEEASTIPTFPKGGYTKKSRRLLK